MADEWIAPALLAGVTLGVLIAAPILYVHYKTKEHEAYLKWRDEVLKLNPEFTLPNWSPWEFEPGKGPSAQTFYL